MFIIKEEGEIQEFQNFTILHWSCKECNQFLCNIFDSLVYERIFVRFNIYDLDWNVNIEKERNHNVFRCANCRFKFTTNMVDNNFVLFKKEELTLHH